MDAGFWDSSSIVPLCVRQKATPFAQELGEKHRMVVAWFAPVEIRGGIARLVRTGQITANQQVQGLVFLDIYRADWREIAPSAAMREKAEDFVERFPLRSADALQLASAWAWCLGHPRGRPFISGDAQLLEAAQRLGFKTIGC
jgi:predicted nucleic acid-binding protein